MAMRFLAIADLRSASAAFGLLIVATGNLRWPLIAASWIVPFDPAAQDIMQRLEAAASGEGDPMAGCCICLGTEALGRDIFSRLVVGAQVSLLVGVASVLASPASSAWLLACIAGYDDRYIGRFLLGADRHSVRGALPGAGAGRRSLCSAPACGIIILVLGLTNWVQYARVVRAECLSAARARICAGGLRARAPRPPRILFKHLLPNVMSSVIVISSLLVAKMILFESALSFLGLGVPPATPTWGAMIAEGRNYIGNAWWVAAMPGLAIFITVIGINLAGDRLRDLLDPTAEAGGELMTERAGARNPRPQDLLCFSERGEGPARGRRGKLCASTPARPWAWSANPARARASPRCRSCGWIASIRRAATPIGEILFEGS